jgi:hypothetical protein
VGGGLTWLLQKACEQAGQVKKALSVAWTWSLQKVSQGCARVAEFGCYLKDCVVGDARTVGAVLGQVWQFRQSYSLAAGVGVLTGLAGFLVGPTGAAVLCGLGGAVLTLSGLVLVPLTELLLAPCPI